MTKRQSKILGGLLGGGGCRMGLLAGFLGPSQNQPQSPTKLLLKFR